MINAPSNMNSVDSKTSELIKEMFYSIKNELYPCYNSAMLLFRPLLSHILTDINGNDNSDLNYSETINEIAEEFNLNSELITRMHKMRNFVNEINHKYEIVLDDDIDKVLESWNIIKELIEIIY